MQIIQVILYGFNDSIQTLRRILFIFIFIFQMLFFSCKIHTVLLSRTANRLTAQTAAARVIRPRPQPIAGTPPPDPNEKCDANIIQQTCNLFGLDLVCADFEHISQCFECNKHFFILTFFFLFQERPPPVPPSRSYTVTGNSKLGYPQTRIMKMNFPEFSALNPPTKQLRKGEQVTVVGASHRRGHLIVQHKGVTFNVPFQYMELVKAVPSAGPVNI